MSGQKEAIGSFEGFYRKQLMYNEADVLKNFLHDDDVSSDEGDHLNHQSTMCANK